jgi:hypothetical protein
MDCVDGESAGERLKRKGRLSEGEAVEIVLGAAEGLAWCATQFWGKCLIVSQKPHPSDPRCGIRPRPADPSHPIPPAGGSCEGIFRPS